MASARQPALLSGEDVMDRGFILQPTYRIEQGRPVVHLFGVTIEGQSFVVRDTRVRPSFFLRSADLVRARPILADADAQALGPASPSRWRSLDGDEVVEVFVATPPDVPPLRERLGADGIECLEADVPFVTRYLCDRGLRGAIGIDGPWRHGRRVERIYENVPLHPAVLEPHLRVLALDIETDPSATRIYAWALYANLPHGGRVAEVHYVATAEHRDLPSTVAGAYDSGLCYDHPQEAALLEALARRVREIDPDVITGWNVIDFDLAVLEKAFARCGVPFHLGRADLPCRVQIRTGAWGTSRASVHGRAVVDGLDLLRGAFIRPDSYALDAVAREILGEGKVLTEGDRGEAIERLYRGDLPHFLAYNLTDARLVIEILEARDLVSLAVRRSLLTGLPIDRVAGSIAAFDFLYLGELHRRGAVAPSVHGGGEDPYDGPQPAAIGGYVLESAPGLYENVWLFDYRSLYPSIIRTFSIDPLGYHLAARDPHPERLIRAPNGATFVRDTGVLPQILAELFPRREQARAAGETTVATAIKILMNSFYGVLATPRCRFFSTQVSNAITTFGQTILLWTRDRLEHLGYRVIYGDTDSVFAVSGIADSAHAEATGREVVTHLNEDLARWIRETHDVESHLMLEFERLYVKFFMPTLRHAAEGSKKRYAGLVGRGAQRELVFTGLESVRRDWTVLAKDFQRRLLLRVFDGEDVEPFIVEYLRDLRAGRRDGDLIYRKALRKPIEDYGKTTPPHVKAARLIPGRPGRMIAYVMTTEGPQPVGHVTAPLDHEHYVEKQLRPIAEAILVHVGKNFDDIAGKGSQLGLL
jgi:DNA polymerase II